MKFTVTVLLTALVPMPDLLAQALSTRSTTADWDQALIGESKLGLAGVFEFAAPDQVFWIRMPSLDWS